MNLYVKDGLHTSSVKLPYLLRLAALLGWLGLMVVGLAGFLGAVDILLVVLTFFFIGGLVNNRSSVQMMFFLGYTTFIFLPAVLNWYYLNIGFDLFYASSFAALVFIKLTSGTIVKPAEDYGWAVRGMFLLMCGLSVGLTLLGLSGISSSLFAFLILLMVLSFKQGRYKYNALYFSAFFLAFSTYALFSWSGYGRTVVIGWLILAGLFFLYSIGFYINKYFFALVPGFASAFLANRNILKLEFAGFEAALNDSAYAPYRIASGFINHFHQRGYDVSGFIDQLVFTFLIFIPRAIWADKPLGFGFEYTMRHLPDYLVDSGHSIASTLIGDHIYYLGHFGIITGVIVLIILALITNALYKIKGLNGNGVILFSASMMVLVWGGDDFFLRKSGTPINCFYDSFFVITSFYCKKNEDCLEELSLI